METTGPTGVLTEEEIQKKPSVMFCPRCSLVNALDNKYCSKCSYPLVASAFEEIKAAGGYETTDTEGKI